MKWIQFEKKTPKRPPDRVDEYGRKWFTPCKDYIVTDDKGRVYVATYSFDCQHWNEKVGAV